MKSIFKSEIQINIIKHSVEKVDKWRWLLYDPWTYGIESMTSGFKFNNETEAEDNFKEFAKLNGIKNYKFEK